VADSPQVQVSEPAPNRFEAVASPAHTVGMLLIVAGAAYLGYRSIHKMQATGNLNHFFIYSTTIAWEWALVGYIAWGIRQRGKTIRSLVGGSWKSAKDFLIDLGIAFGFWLAALVVLGLVARALHITGAQKAARALAPNGWGESLAWIALSVTAGFCEELIFRGYLQRQLAAWTHNAPVAVLLSAAVFGAGHIYQGARATVVIGVFGLMFGILAEGRHSLRPGIMTHAWHDAITGLLMRFLPK
jgi:uncharacterized protein